MATVRLQKILARAGVASRRAAEALITEGRVRVNGRIVTELGAKADPRDRVEVDGKRIVAEAPVYLVFHKPRGVVSTMSDPEGRPTVRDYLKDAGGRIYPVGRLDYATSGVLLATNDGGFADGLLHPRRQVPKTYVLKVDGVMQEKDLELWRRGVRLEDGVTQPARVSLLRYEGDKTWIEITLHEGRNQQIRRMGEATGFRVMRLARTVFAGIRGEGLRPGAWRPLRAEELLRLQRDYGVPRRVPAPGVLAEQGPPGRPAETGRFKAGTRWRRARSSERGAPPPRADRREWREGTSPAERTPPREPFPRRAGSAPATAPRGRRTR